MGEGEIGIEAEGPQPQMDVYLAKVSPGETYPKNRERPTQAPESTEQLIQESPEELIPTGEGWVIERPEKESEPLEYRHITDKIAERLQLPEPTPLTFRERLAANTMRFQIAHDLLRRKPITEATFHTSKALAQENLPRFPENSIRPQGREGESSWGKYAVRVLNGNENTYNLPPNEWEEHQASTRFNVLVPVEKSSDEIEDMQEHVFNVFKDGPHAQPWLDGTEIIHSYKVGVHTKDDVVALDAREEGGWEKIDPSQYTGKVVYIRTGGASGEMTEAEQRVMKTLLDNNKFIIREINDPVQGNMLEAVVNHNWIDAGPLKRAMNQIAKPMGGYREVPDDTVFTQMVTESADRYNALHPNAKTKMRVTVLNQAECAQIEELRQNYIDAIPKYPRIAEVNDRDTDPEALAVIPHKIGRGLSQARFWQLIAQRAAGVDGENVKGGVLRFMPENDQELDHFETYKSLEDIKTNLEVATKPETSKKNSRHAINQLVSLADTYNGKRSNITGKIAAAIRQLPREKERLEMALATMKSGAARGNSGQIMTSYSESQVRQSIRIKDRGSSAGYYDPEMSAGIASSAHPSFMDSSFSITTETEGKGRNKSIRRAVISVKY